MLIVRLRSCSAGVGNGRRGPNRVRCCDKPATLRAVEIHESIIEPVECSRTVELAKRPSPSPDTPGRLVRKEEVACP
jgi:hypothetical protein